MRTIGEIKILHSEKSFVIVVKPEGVLSENGAGTTPGMVDLLSQSLDAEVFPVHRLDREASGIMVYATSKQAASKLSALVSGEGFEKRYLIVVHGIPEKEQGIMEDLLFKDSKKNKSFVVTRERKGVKRASLEYELIKTAEQAGESFSLIRVKLHTGRTHQIRVQFSSRNMPVVGDSRYGSGIKTDMCLFSGSIGFVNPYTGEKMSFGAKPDFSLFSTLFENEIMNL